MVSLRLEKQQVAALAEYLAGILADLPAAEEITIGNTELVEPVTAEWVVGSLAVAYEESEDRVLIVAEELVADDEDDEPSSRHRHGAGNGPISRHPCAGCLLRPPRDRGRHGRTTRPVRSADARWIRTVTCARRATVTRHERRDVSAEAAAPASGDCSSAARWSCRDACPGARTTPFSWSSA